MKKILFASLLLSVLTACKKSDDKKNYKPIDDESAVYYRGQTQCSDEWGYSGEDALTKLMLQEYVKSKGVEIKVLDLTAPPKDVAWCAACTCSSGRVFVILGKKADDAKLKALGFYQ